MLIPNPGVSQATIAYDVESPGSVKNLICDLQGKQVFQYKGLCIVPGKQQIILNLEKLASGIYQIMVKTGSQVLCEKMAVNK